MTTLGKGTRRAKGGTSSSGVDSDKIDRKQVPKVLGIYFKTRRDKRAGENGGEALIGKKGASTGGNDKMERGRGSEEVVGIV